MNLLVTRKTFSPFSTIGELTTDGLKLNTMEPPRREAKPRCIPAGTYDVSIRWSPKHGRLIPHVENVPGFEEIEIHVGNFPADTQGCLLVGRTVGPNPDFIGGSKLAFEELFHKLADAKDRGEAITITYQEEK